MEKCNAKIFQQDDATCHTAKVFIQHFRENGVPFSNIGLETSDLSQIENLWGTLKAKLHKTPVSSINHMKMLLLDGWEKKLADSVSGCLQEVLENNGNGIGK